MDIILHPGSAIFADLLCSNVKPRDRLALAMAQIIEGPAFVASNLAISKAKAEPPSAVMQAVLRDGYDYLVAQQLFGLFSPARKVEASAWALEQLHIDDTFNRLRVALARAAEQFAPELLPETMQVLLVPADPSNRNVMIRNSGLSVFGGAFGYVMATVWPSAGNLARLPAAVVRAFALGVHWNNAGASKRYTLADALLAEGQAASLVAAFPEASMPWLVAHAAPASWTTDLAHAAALYGVESYDQVPANVYGGTDVSLEPPPIATPLDAAELQYAEAVLAAAHDASDPRTIAAHLYGDEIASAQGHPQAGLPPYAGFEVGFRHSDQKN